VAAPRPPRTAALALDEGDQKHAHLQYADFPLGETRFQ
jgi:hypothetical protein